MNIDDNEVNKFNDLAHAWWDTEGELKTLHDINPLRLKYIKEHCSLENKSVLDVGCGGGILSEALAKSGAKVTAIDASDQSIQIANLHKAESKLEIDYHNTTAEEFAETHQNAFDTLACLEMLEHVPNPSSVIRACASMVKPGGDLFFSTLNRNPKSFLFAIVGAEYIMRMIPTGTHEYAKFIKPAELDCWAREAGLTLQHMIGLHYNPFTKNYSLQKDVSVNYMVHMKK